MTENNDSQMLADSLFEDLANKLAQSPDYIVLKRFPDLPELNNQVPDGAEVGLVLDTETTGKNPSDAIIELGVVAFAFSPETGEVLGVLDRYCGLEDPKRPIPPEASKVNGITDEMVQGQSLDTAKINGLRAQASLVIAHNSDFDRPKVEERLPEFADMPWACSMSQVPWGEAGVETIKLKYIAHELGYFYEAHRADADCLATLQVLNQPLLELDGQTGLQLLLKRSREATLRLWAVNSPFSTKDVLKGRGYRWSDGSMDGWEKAWYKDFDSEEELAQEAQWLRSDVYRSRFSVPVTKLDAYCRFSARAGKTERRYFE